MISLFVSRFSRISIVAGFVVLSASAMAGDFYITGCAATSPENNVFDQGTYYTIQLESDGDGLQGQYVGEIRIESLANYPGWLSFARWFNISIKWTFRWVPDYPQEEPPFGKSGSISVVLDHNAGYGIGDGAGASVGSEGYAFSSNIAWHYIPGTFLDITYEYSTPYSGEYHQGGGWFLDPDDIIETGWFEYDEEADDGSWIGYCIVPYGPYYLETTVETEPDEGAAVGWVQVAGTMDITTIGGQAPVTTTGGTTGGSSSSSTGTTTLGGSDSGDMWARNSGDSSTPVFPMAILAMVATAALASKRLRRV